MCSRCHFCWRHLEQEVAENVAEPALVFIGCPVPVNDEEFIALVGRDREHRFGGAVGVETATQRLLVGEERDDSGGSEVAARFDVGEEGREFRIGAGGVAYLGDQRAGTGRDRADVGGVAAYQLHRVGFGDKRSGPRPL